MNADSLRSKTKDLSVFICVNPRLKSSSSAACQDAASATPPLIAALKSAQAESESTYSRLMADELLERVEEEETK